MFPDQRQESDEVKRLFWRLMIAPRLPFPDTGERLDAPNEKGVYLIEDFEGRVLHVGRTPQKKKGIRQQLQNHLNSASSFVHAHFDGDGSKLRGSCWFRYLVLESWRLRALLEAYAVGCLCPIHIGRDERVPESPLA